MKIVGKSIRQLRQRKGMTQAQLAEKLGVQYQTVSKWETGSTMPDTAMLPRIADALDASIDDLFGRGMSCSGESLPEDDRDFLLRSYTQMYGREALGWNQSVENKYLEYRFADFFERHFPVAKGADICNIGIGAGEWDHYLTTKLKNGTLTSIDKLEVCCRQLRLRLKAEENPCPVQVICGDALELSMPERFDIVTVVGSTAMERGAGLGLLKKAFTFLKHGGALYYQSLKENEDITAVLQLAFSCGMTLGAMEEDRSHNVCGRYHHFEKP